jgi:phosphotransferase system HPr (HPr) family protein
MGFAEARVCMCDLHRDFGPHPATSLSTKAARHGTNKNCLSFVRPNLAAGTRPGPGLRAEDGRRRPFYRSRRRDSSRCLCDGEVVSVHPAGYAVTLRTAEGMELIMHVGIDTVTLKGEGFIPRVKAGDKVKAGAPLIQFDLDFLATHAKSLLTQIVVANSDRVTSWERASGFVEAGKDLLFIVTFAAESGAPSEVGAKTVTSEAILIPNRTGLHARPAAVLANVARSFKSAIKLQLGERHANARSVTAIMALEVASGAKVQVVATGPDASAAVEKLSAILAQGCGDEGCEPASTPATTTMAPSAAPPPRRKSADPDLMLGVVASPGFAVGEVFQVRRVDIEAPESGAGVEAERQHLTAALAGAQGQLAALRAQLHAKADPRQGRDLRGPRRAALRPRSS